MDSSLACIAIITNLHNVPVSLKALQKKYQDNGEIINLGLMINILNQLNFSAIAYQYPIEDIYQIDLPCIIHWNLSSFKILTAIEDDSLSLEDSTNRTMKISIDVFERHYNEVVLVV